MAKFKIPSALIVLLGVLTSIVPASALSVPGPHSTDPLHGGYTIVVGNAAPFDFIVEDYPVFPLQGSNEPNPGQPSAWLDVTVDYGDGSKVFTASYPAIDTASREFHIKDRTFSAAAHPALDDAAGFIFNEFPYYAQYPQDHRYGQTGAFNLNIHAEVRAEVPGLDLSAHSPLEINVPVQVLSQEESPELSLESTRYNLSSDELTIKILYQGPQEIQLSINEPTAEVQAEIMDYLMLDIAHIQGALNIMSIPFADWEITSVENSANPNRPWETHYQVVIENATERLGLNPASSAFRTKITYGKDGQTGLIGNWYILDADYENNYQEFIQGAPTTVDLENAPHVESNSTSYTVIEGNTALFDYIVEDYPVFQNDLNPDQTLVWLDVTVDYGDGSEVFTESYPAVEHHLPFHIKDRSFTPNAHPASDDSNGFLFNEFPYYAQYPQGHQYTTAGNYTLNIQAALRSENPNLDLSSYAPIEIQAPVRVLRANEAPELSIEYTEYDPVSDELTVELLYQGPQELALSIEEPSEEVLADIMQNFNLDVLPVNAPARRAKINFSEWEVLSSTQVSIGVRPYQTQYKVTFEDASNLLGVNPAADPLKVSILNGKDGVWGTMSNQLILDENLSNNSQDLHQGAPLKMTLDLGSDTTIRAGRILRQSGVLNNINPASTAVTYTLRWGDRTPEVNGSFAPTTTTRTFNLSHAYATRGIYTVSLCADDGFREVCDQIKVTVN